MKPFWGSCLKIADSHAHITTIFFMELKVISIFHLNFLLISIARCGRTEGLFIWDDGMTLNYIFFSIKSQFSSSSILLMLNLLLKKQLIRNIRSIALYQPFHRFFIVIFYISIPCWFFCCAVETSDLFNGHLIFNKSHIILFTEKKQIKFDDVSCNVPTSHSIQYSEEKTNNLRHGKVHTCFVLECSLCWIFPIERNY